MTKKTYPVIGMHCAACKSLIEMNVRELKGVTKANVNFASEKLSVEYDETKIELKDLQKAVSGAGGYELILDSDLSSKTQVAKDIISDKKSQAFQSLKVKTIWVFIGTIPFWLMMIFNLASIFFMDLKDPFMQLGTISIDNSNYKISVNHLLQLVLATPILFVGGGQFFSSAWSALKSKTANMDTLISLGTFTAWFYSSLVTFFPNYVTIVSNNEEMMRDPEVFFEASVFIVFFILLGRVLEAKAKSQTNEAVKKLVEMQAKEANVIRNGKEIKLPIDALLISDIVIVRPGEKVSTDGVIVEGQTTIDESMITGESLPVEKGLNDKVIGATINKSGTFKFKVLKLGTETMLSQIVKMVEEAQSSEAPIQKLADKVSGIFVPIVIAISFFAFIFWMFIAPSLALNLYVINYSQIAIYTAVTVLVIACPCGLGLATPTAVMVGTGNAARKGILVKNAESLEIANKISTVVMDKTGTITKGQPEVTEFVIIDDIAQQEDFKKYKTNLEGIRAQILNIAASLENKSEHPISNAIEKYSKQAGKFDSVLEIHSFHNYEGKGVGATINGREVLIGNLKLMNDKGIILNTSLGKTTDSLVSAGKTVVFLAYDGAQIALFAIADTIKEDSKHAIDQLRSLGIKTIMLTGDNNKVAESIAKQVGIDEFIAEVLPDEKLNTIKNIQLSNPGKVIAMVGDGINDSPALAQADIGIAVGSGTDIAIESADIILVKGSLTKVVEAINVSHDTLKVIRQNLFWAFGYNILAIPIAAGALFIPFGVLLSPVIASVAMAMSSVSVVMNSLRLKRMG